jgi:agmatine deiminase
VGVHAQQEGAHVRCISEIESMESPASLGYRMPAEWEKHQATWLSWPKDPGTFPGDILSKVEAAYVEMVEALSVGEEVRVLVNDERAEGRVRSLLRGSDRVSFQRLKTVDVWVRDYGPTGIKGEDIALVRWRFNAWGNKYADLLPDDAAGDAMAAESGLRVFRPGIVLEGGSVDVNGSGSLLTTEQCLLNPNRNPGLRKPDLESVLRESLGVEDIIWLDRGIEGDDTDGHVDDIARFVGPRDVVIAAENNLSDPNHTPLMNNMELLERSERSMNIHEIPMPPRLEAADGLLPASHLNFYIGNSVVLVPTFGGSSDKEALRVLEKFFPSIEVIGIDCRALVYGLGALHCVTQQIPSF